MGIIVSKSETWSESTIKSLISDYQTGKPIKEIKEAYRISLSDIYKILSLNKIETRNQRDKKLIPTHKRCKTCKLQKSLDQFKVHPQNSDGHGAHCLDCYRLKDRKISQSKRKRDYYKRYNITEEIYQSTLKEQNNCCKLCGSKYSLVIDHCHKTGKFRGIICNNCNWGLGCFKDSVEVLQKVIGYLSSK